MGIPGFYREIIKKYDIQKFNLDHELDYFFQILMELYMMYFMDYQVIKLKIIQNLKII